MVALNYGHSTASTLRLQLLTHLRHAHGDL